MALIPKPARQSPETVKRNARVVRLSPLEIRSLALTRPGAKEEAARAKAAAKGAAAAAAKRRRFFLFRCLQRRARSRERFGGLFIRLHSS